MLFFFCQIMVKTKPKNVFTKNSMLLFVSFLFLGEDFSHFCRLLFCRNLLHLGAVADLENFGGGDFEAKNLKNSDVFTEIESDFAAEIGNSNVFFAQNQVVSKKKERSSPKLRVIFRPKSVIQTFFSPKIRWSPKKRSSPKLRVIFRPKSEIQTFF